MNPGSATQRRSQPSCSVGILEIAQDGTSAAKIIYLDELGPRIHSPVGASGLPDHARSVHQGARKGRHGFAPRIRQVDPQHASPCCDERAQVTLGLGAVQRPQAPGPAGHRSVGVVARGQQHKDPGIGAALM